MSRAYLRIDPAFFERKALTQGYPAGVFSALVGTLCLAEHQPERGRFRSERLLRALLEDYGRHVPELIRRGDLVRLEDGRLYVDGWDEWQEGDWKVGERVARIRSRPRNGAAPVTVKTTAYVTPDVTVPVTVDETAARLSVIDSVAVGGKPKAVSGRREASRALGMEPISAILPDLTLPPEDAYGVSEDEARVFAFLARFGAAIRPDSGYGRRLLGLMERRGVEDVLRHAGIMAKSGERLSDRQWVFGLEAALEAVPGAKDARAADKAEEDRKHSERVQEEMRARREERARYVADPIEPSVIPGGVS